MTRIRGSAIEGFEGLDTRGPCIFCEEVVTVGAYWRAAGEIRLCVSCAWDGVLGKLLGDAALDCRALERMLDSTAREAWRALALAQERKRR